MSNPVQLLLVEDSEDDADLFLNHLKKSKFLFVHERVDNKEKLLLALKKEWDLVICDYNLPSFTAPEVISLVKSIRPELPLVVVSGSIGEEVAVQTMKAGASDYIMKGNFVRLIPAIKRAIEERAFRVESKQIEQTLKQKEDELRQAQKLDALGQLAGGIAHDFNNLLAAILMDADFLLEEMNSETPSAALVEKAKQGFQRIKKTGSRASSLTRQLLAFSRKQVLQTQVLNINDQVLDIQNMLRPIVEANIEFNLSLDKNIKNIKADPSHIQQVIMNLVVNARDAMPSGGVIEISTFPLTVDNQTAKKNGVDAGEYILLMVRDHGTGMSPEVQKRIFEPFFTTKPVGKGTGLGLSTVYGIVKQNGGYVSLESEIGKGTAFKITFPRVDDQIVVKNTAQLTDSQLCGTETILFVEDEVELKNIVSRALEKRGYKVLTASNGLEAIECMKNNSSIHLVITDVVMPHMGGVELAEKVQQYSKGTKILFQSGYTEDTLLQGGINTGYIHYIEKPYGMKTFLTKIRSVLG